MIETYLSTLVPDVAKLVVEKYSSYKQSTVHMYDLYMREVGYQTHVFDVRGDSKCCLSLDFDKPGVYIHEDSVHTQPNVLKLLLVDGNDKYHCIGLTFRHGSIFITLDDEAHCYQIFSDMTRITLPCSTHKQFKQWLITLCDRWME